jgi:hypothetical protein
MELGCYECVSVDSETLALPQQITFTYAFVFIQTIIIQKLGTRLE